MNRNELIEAYSTYEYNATFNYGEGQAYIESNHPWYMVYIAYRGDATITPNFKNIKMQARFVQGGVFFKQLTSANPQSNLFEYFGELEVLKAKIFGFKGNKKVMTIKSPNYDQPELIDSFPEDFTRMPEKVKNGFLHTNKKTLKLYSNKKKAKSKKQAAKRATKTKGVTSGRTTSGGSTY